MWTYQNSCIILRLINRISISAVPLYAGLRRFEEGRDFEQWTGDDSKALMKVYFYHVESDLKVLTHGIHVGLYRCYRRPRTVNNGTVPINLHGSLLYISTKCNHRHCPRIG